MQAARRLPGAIPHGRDALPVGARRAERNSSPVAEHREAFADHPSNLDLDALKGAVHIPHGGPARRLLAEHVPWLQCCPQFDVDVALCEFADFWKPVFKVGQEPIWIDREPLLREVAENFIEIRLAKVREHPSVVKLCTP